MHKCTYNSSGPFLCDIAGVDGVGVSFSLQVAPRLAIAAMAMREDKDARKSIRDVFSAGDDVQYTCTFIDQILHNMIQGNKKI